MDPIRLGQDAILPLTQVPVAKLQRRVLVVGDPHRAAAAAALLDDHEALATNREYVSYNGTFQGTPITVISHGVGASGAACCFEELCRGGAQVIIRAGTAGGLQPNVRDGDLLVATAAVRADGLSGALVPLAYPAVADLGLTHTLAESARLTGLPVHVGVVATMAAFYPSPLLPNEQLLWRDAGALGVEMEVAALYITAALHRVQASAVLTIDGNPLADDDEAMTSYDPAREVVGRAVAASLTLSLTVLAATELD